jgi:Spy/CpxP family protein refolding chaperone
MSRAKLVILSAFVLVLVAGVMVGRLWARLPMQGHAPPPTDRSPSWLADELQLTPEQRQQMDAIWADVRQKNEQKLERRRSLDHERDQAIEELLGPEQWAAYGRLMDEFRLKHAAVDKERETLFRDANERSVALLNGDQKKKWDQLRAQPHHDHDRGGPGGGGHDWHRGGPGGPTTQKSPATGGGDGLGA